MTADAKASISVRKHIKWGDAVASESTSTLVLTSPEGTFVDVRLLLVPVKVENEDEEKEQKLEWAFAGTSSHDGDADPPHSVFRHWVDSRFVDAESVRDEGDMVSGKEGETVEMGVMVNPGTGRLEQYEECWLDGLPSEGGSGGWVLKYDVDSRRGIVVRIGEFVQGVLRIGDEVGVGRWKFDGRGSREAVAEIGRVDGFPFEGWDRVKLGDSLVGHWTCVESW